MEDWNETAHKCGECLLYRINTYKKIGIIKYKDREVHKKSHLYITFDDDSFLTATTQMWDAFELYETGEELKREYIKGMRTTPFESEFTNGYFNTLIDELVERKKLSANALLT